MFGEQTMVQILVTVGQSTNTRDSGRGYFKYSGLRCHSAAYTPDALRLFHLFPNTVSPSFVRWFLCLALVLCEILFSFLFPRPLRLFYQSVSLLLLSRFFSSVFFG